MATPSALDIFLHQFELNSTTSCRLATLFAKTYRRLALESTNQFLATPINVLPRGHETGCYLAIDVGGSNLRVGFVELLGKNSLVAGDRNVGGGAVIPGGKIEGKLVRNTNVKSWAIEDHFKNDNEEQFFYWIGDCIAEVVRAQIAENNLPKSQVIPVGITFSFPMIQTSISDAILMPMGKGFKIRSNLGLDGLLLAGYRHHVHSDVNSDNFGPSDESLRPNDASHLNDLHRFNSTPSSPISSSKLPPIRIVAITNDSVATMASLSYSLSASPNARVAMGLIVATGTNATTTMPIRALLPSKTETLRFPVDPWASNSIKADEPRVVVNTEWGINGTLPPIEEVGLRTKWDIELDANCSAPGFQPFEYMTSGRYLGELVRLILVSYLVDNMDVSMEDMPSSLQTPYSLLTIFLSNVVARATSAEQLLPQLDAAYPPKPGTTWKWTLEAAEAFLRISQTVVLRSARMNAAACVGVLAAAGDLDLLPEEEGENGISEPVSPKGAPTDILQLSKEKEELIIAHAGGVICQFPRYLELCSSAVQELVDALSPGRKVTFRETRDGGLVGAAVLAGTVWSL